MKLLILTTQDRFFLSHVLERALYIKDKGWEIIVATEKTSNTKRFNELNYKVLSELKRENRFTI